MCVHYKSAYFSICLWLNHVDVQALDEHVFLRESTDMSS